MAIALTPDNTAKNLSVKITDGIDVAVVCIDGPYIRLGVGQDHGINDEIEPILLNPSAAQEIAFALLVAADNNHLEASTSGPEGRLAIHNKSGHRVVSFDTSDTPLVSSQLAQEFLGGSIGVKRLKGLVVDTIDHEAVAIDAVKGLSPEYQKRVHEYIATM